MEDRVRSHRTARRSRWLQANNEALAAWLRRHDPAAIVLDEVAEDEDADLWQIEKMWIQKYASYGLFNKNGNPEGPPRRRGRAESPSTVAA